MLRHLHSVDYKNAKRFATNLLTHSASLLLPLTVSPHLAHTVFLRLLASPSLYLSLLGVPSRVRSATCNILHLPAVACWQHLTPLLLPSLLLGNFEAV